MNIKTIYLLHGWGGTKKSLEPLALNLREFGYEVVILEMPGHGSTKDANFPWNMTDFAKWAKLQIGQKKQYILIGHSFGGKIILEGITSGLIAPEKVVLINSNGIKQKNSVKINFWKFISSFKKVIDSLPFGEKLKEIIYKFIIREQDYLKSKKSTFLNESFKIFNQENYDDKLHKINTKTLILWGRNDSVTPLWMGKKLHQEIKNSKLKVLDDTHGLPLKQPELVANIINQFLQND